jgi:hypothetical protein
MRRYSRKSAIPASGFRFRTQLKVKMTELRDIHTCSVEHDDRRRCLTDERRERKDAKAEYQDILSA